MELVRRDERRDSQNGPPDETRLGVAEQVLGWLSNEVGRFTRGGTAKYVFTSFKMLPLNIFIPSGPTRLRTFTSFLAGRVDYIPSA